MNEHAANEQPEDLRRLRPERHPNTDFLSALTDRVGRDRVQAHRREQEGDEGKEANMEPKIVFCHR